MLRIIFSLDYEIHGNGEGSPQSLMVSPTNRLLTLLDQHGAKLTIMADVAEIIRFQEHRDRTGRDDFDVGDITEQLRRALGTGHDVQLHIHPSYFEANWRDGKWDQDYSRYDLTQLGPKSTHEAIRRGKEFLETLLRADQPGYACTVFRAANWSMQPSRDVVRALVANGIAIDTSVFKYGRREGLVNFDYADAWSDLVPWPVSETNVCVADPRGALFEVPIYAEHRWIGAFASPLRVYRALLGRLHPVRARLESEKDRGWAHGLRALAGRLRRAITRHAWKLDFNQCTGHQLIAGLKRAASKAEGVSVDLPLVLIGHSKLFTRANARHLTPFLEYVADRPATFSFGLFSDIDLDAIRNAFHSSKVP